MGAEPLGHEVEDRWYEPREARVNVGGVERCLSIAAGSALAAYALKRRAGIRGTAALLGAALVYRGATGHCDVYEALGIDHARGNGARFAADVDSDTRRRLGGSAGIRVEESVSIDRPVAEVYRFWRDFENLPTFMKHLVSVAVREAGITHWVARGPAGLEVAWDARIINEIENKLIAWQSLEGSTISTAGSVNFRESNRGTDVRVRLQYDPPAGKLGAAVARLFREEPGLQIRQDLRRLKQLLETVTSPPTPTGR